MFTFSYAEININFSFFCSNSENNGEYVENKILLPQLAKMVAYTERILTGSGSSLIMSGRCGYGRKTAVRIVAARTSAHLLCPKVSYEYSLMNFKNDMKSVNVCIVVYSGFFLLNLKYLSMSDVYRSDVEMICQVNVV